ncbi:MAG: RsmD family RNA methyltransferase [Bacteroidales bacterium]
MRIVGGTFRGRHFTPPKSFNARPTTDFAKESLFNIINNNYDFEELRVLDLFSGTGSISFEFISRGAVRVDSIEVNFVHNRFIKETAQKLGVANLSAIKADVFSFINRCSAKYSIIFADPPYDLKGIDQIPDIIFQRELLEDGGCFILEHSGSYMFTNHPFFKEHRAYGSVNFSFFAK